MIPTNLGILEKHGITDRVVKKGFKAQEGLFCDRWLKFLTSQTIFDPYICNTNFDYDRVGS